MVWLRRVEDLPQKVVAAQLGISEKTVEKHVANGIRLIAEYFYGGAPASSARAAPTPAPEHGHDHGQQQTD